MLNASHQPEFFEKDEPMPKRFTATEKWEKEWFQNLSSKHKLFWIYLCDKCDQAGVWEPNFRLASYFVGETFKEPDMAVFGPRIVKLPSGSYWIVKFIMFQYGELSTDCRPHTPVFQAIAKHGLTEDFINQKLKAIDTLLIEYRMGTGTSTRKGKGKEGGTGGNETPPSDPLQIPENLKTPEFVATWPRWMEVRRGLGRKPKDWGLLFGEQLTWLSQYGEPAATEILKQSIRNGWQGLFPLKNPGAINRGPEGSQKKENLRSKEL